MRIMRSRGKLNETDYMGDRVKFLIKDIWWQSNYQIIMY